MYHILIIDIWNEIMECLNIKFQLRVASTCLYFHKNLCYDFYDGYDPVLFKVSDAIVIQYPNIKN